MSKIRIFVFVEKDNQAVNNRATEVWFEVEHPNREYIYSLVNEPQSQDFINQMQVTKFPTVIFAEQQNASDWLTRARIEGDTSKAQIKKVYLAALNGEFQPEGDPNNQGTTDIIIPGDGGFGVNPFGFELFNLNLPPFIWLIIAGAAGIKAATSKKPAGQIGFGSLAALAIVQFLNSKNKSNE